MIDLDDLPTRDPVWLTCPSDSNRRAERYCDGRVFLDGDDGHLDWAYGDKQSV